MDEPIPISLVAHTVFCRRRAWLEANGEAVVHSQIEAGIDAHRAVDDSGTSRPTELRAVVIENAALGLSGRCDVVRQSSGDDSVSIVEYKSTPTRRRAEVTEAQRVQLTLQRICLEDMGIPVKEQGVFFTDHNTYVGVEATRDLRALAEGYVADTRRLIESQRPPEPLVDSPRCRSCSHVTVCLPDEIAGRRPARAVSAADPDGQILHLATPGSRAYLRSGRLLVGKSGEQLASLPVGRVFGLVIHGNVDVSSALLRELWLRRASVVWCTSQGRVVAWSCSLSQPNGGTRVMQHVASSKGRLDIARQLISAKIANQATQLRRNSEPSNPDVDRLRELQKSALAAKSIPELFGIEGTAARLYFDGFPSLLRAPALWLLTDWEGRRGRRAVNPLNALLNYAYGLLLADCIRALVACGLDPAAGFLHSPSRNKPALALDLMEEFRTPIADSVVLAAVNTSKITESDLTSTLGCARLRDSGRKSLIGAYERRLSGGIIHPVFGYRVSWRRAIEVQARMIMAVLEGSRSSYEGIRTR